MSLSDANRNVNGEQRMTFIESGADDVLRIDTTNPPDAPHEPEHLHPLQESRARVLSGALRFRVGGVERVVHAAEEITIPPNSPHQFWNDGRDDARCIQEFRPALETRALFETLFALAQQGRLDDRGTPGCSNSR
jgi:uncharacterized RmlC-like cupin family protein